MSATYNESFAPLRELKLELLGPSSVPALSTLLDRCARVRPRAPPDLSETPHMASEPCWHRSGQRFQGEFRTLSRADRVLPGLSLAQLR